MGTRRRVVEGLLRTAAATVLVGPARWPAARAQEAAGFPSRPVRLVVPFGPGGTTDFLARLLQPPMQAFLGQPVVVENRAGAAGNIASEHVARSAPDGHTVFVGDVGTISINASIFPDMRVDPIRDLVAVSIVADTPSLLVAAPSFPPNSVAELVDYARARPGQVSFASQGSGSINRLIMEMLADKAGLRLVHVPYRGGNAPATADIIAGHVPMMFATVPAVIGHVRGGRLKALGVTAAERHPALPELRTLREAGFPNLAVSSWQGLFAPAATPKPVIEKLHSALTAALNAQGVGVRITEAGSLVAPGRTPEDAARFVADEATRWGAVARTVGATAD